MKTSVGPVILVTTDFYILMSIFSLCKLFLFSDINLPLKDSSVKLECHTRIN